MGRRQAVSRNGGGRLCYATLASDPSSESHGSPPPMSAHPSHASWPHKEPHRRPQWRCSHASRHEFRHTTHTVRGPIGSSTEDDTHNSVTHNCIWLGPSPGYFFTDSSESHRPPTGPQNGPRWPQDGPNTAPRQPQDGPREPQDGPREPQEIPKTAQRSANAPDDPRAL